MASSSENQSVNPPRSALRKVMIGLLVTWLILLIIDIPISGYMIAQQQGAASAVGPVAIEAIFVALLVLFLSYGLRGRRWSFAGATGIGVAHTILSVLVYLSPGEAPLTLGALLTGLPAAVVAIAGGVTLIETRCLPVS